MRTLPQPHRSRRRQRGAALVEGIIVSTMLMTLMAAGLFLHRLYVAQHKALEQARLAAWSQALQGCQSPVDLTAIWHGAGENEAALDVDTGSTPGFFGAISHTSGRASQSVSAHARLGGGHYTSSASDTVACNEIAQDQNARTVETLIGYITSTVIPSIF